MSQMLNQPHPFAVPGPSTAQTPPAPAGAQAAPSAPAQPKTEDSETPEKKPAAGTEDKGDDDPLELVNRFFFGFNEYLQEYLLRHIARAYLDYVPSAVRDSVGNFFHNLRSPIILANDVLQGEGVRAFETLARVGVNTTLGVGGLFDVAKSWFQVEKHNEDFGQTLAVWGVPEMLYIVIPVLGPSSPRDAIGKYVVDGYFDPLGMWLSNTDREWVSWVQFGVEGIHDYASLLDEIDSIRKTSIDFYAAIRSLYRQKREADIRNGAAAPLPNINYDIE
jgi:phospholipid-binding lipoprotein MlaA